MAKPNGNGKKEDRWRDLKEPRQTIQKKDNALNNQLKKSQKNGRQKEGKPSAIPKEQEAIESPPLFPAMTCRLVGNTGPMSPPAEKGLL
jgi:hypothetical protein